MSFKLIASIKNHGTNPSHSSAQASIYWNWRDSKSIARDIVMKTLPYFIFKKIRYSYHCDVFVSLH